MRKNKILIPALLSALLLGCNVADSTYETLVTMDVNPSIQLQLDKNLNVIDTIAVNKEAKQLLESMELKKTQVNVAINAVLGSLVKEGYLTDKNNTVLLSVENKDDVKRVEIEKQLSELVHGTLKDYEIAGAIVSQEMKTDDTIDQLMNKYDISYGKASLINEILDKDSKYKLEDLVKLNAQELTLIYNQSDKKTEDIHIKGEVNTSQYLTKDEALTIALKDANLTKDQIKELEIDYDSEQGIFSYEIEFESQNKEYEYDINAKTGQLTKQIEKDDDKQTVNKNNNTNTQQSSTNYTKQQALSLALKDAKLNQKQIKNLKIETDQDDGKTIYEIDFNYQNKEYSYDVSATKGIIDKDIEVEKETQKPATKPTSTNYTKQQALTLALKDAKLNQNQIKNLKIETDKDDGKTIYEIDFDYQNKEYSYDISATKGIIDKDIETKDS